MSDIIDRLAECPLSYAQEAIEEIRNLRARVPAEVETVPDWKQDQADTSVMPRDRAFAAYRRAVQRGITEREETIAQLRAQVEELAACIEDAVETMESMDIHIGNPLYDRLRERLTSTQRAAADKDVIYWRETAIKVKRENDQLRAQVELAKACFLAIQKATVDGRVCDDVAWFDDITTLHDYCGDAADRMSIPSTVGAPE